MGLGLSMDLRRRVVAAIDDEGMSCRRAAARFGVAPSTAIRWHARARETGSPAPKPQGGDTLSHRIEARASSSVRGKSGATLCGLRVGAGWPNVARWSASARRTASSGAAASRTNTDRARDRAGHEPVCAETASRPMKAHAQGAPVVTTLVDETAISRRKTKIGECRTAFVSNCAAISACPVSA